MQCKLRTRPIKFIMMSIKERAKAHRDVLMYLIFGVITTILNYVVYMACCNTAGLPVILSNVIAWVVAVTFAYVTNKAFVFQSNSWQISVLLPELAKFVSYRIGSGAMETAFLWLSVGMLGQSNIAMKAIANIAVIIVNYVASRMFVFAKGKTQQKSEGHFNDR